MCKNQYNENNISLDKKLVILVVKHSEASDLCFWKRNPYDGCELVTQRTKLYLYYLINISIVKKITIKAKVVNNAEI